jgi:hypothetical protein
MSCRGKMCQKILTLTEFRLRHVKRMRTAGIGRMHITYTLFIAIQFIHVTSHHCFDFGPNFLDKR